MAAVVGVIPKAVLTMSIIHPTRMIADRVEADAADVDADGEGFASLFGDIPKPFGTLVVFDPGLGEDERLIIAVAIFVQNVAQRPIERMTERQLSPVAVMPLVVKIVVESDDVHHVLAAAEVFISPAKEHV